MDKSGLLAKAIVAARPIEPTKEVEFGCEHLQEMMQNSEHREKLTNSFITIQGLLARPVDAQLTVVELKDSTKNCQVVALGEGRDSHCQSRKHVFAIESRSGCLWCGLCEDFVYDPTFERIRMEHSLPSSNGKKRKLGAINPLGDEDKFILPNSNKLSCLSGAPRGIYNLGQTCYMSVILQAMIHNPLMRNYYLASRHDTSECTADNCAACAMTASFTDMLATEKVDGHGPVELLYRSWKNHPDLAGYRQQDAHEYFQSLLNHLHSSEVSPKERTTKNCSCIYHQTFFGRLRSTVTCLKCKNITTAEDPIIDLSLDLRNQVKRRKLEPKVITGEEPLELSGCLKNFTSPEKLGPDAYTCKSPECGGHPQRSRKHLTIKRLPPALCIQLKRYEHNKINPQKVDTKLNFPLQLDMGPYTTRAFRNKKKGIDAQNILAPCEGSHFSPRSVGWYDLVAVVVHVGKIDAGHYICYCRRDDQWFKFDDSKVTLASETQVMSCEAYLLFYIIRSLGTDTKDRRSSGAADGEAD